MKKIAFLIAVMVLGFCFLSGCDDNSGEVSEPTPDPVPDNTVTLYFETYGGEKIEPITKIEPGTVVNLPTPTREGYTFDYWYTTETLEFGTDLRRTVTVNETMTVYAGWFALDYNIEFITNCGINIQNLNALTDETIELPILERENYEFLGWYEDNELYTRTTMEPRNITLVAKWERLAHEVKLSPNGGTIDEHYLTQHIEHNATAILPTPKKIGYVFLGWYNGDELVNEYQTIEEDMTLVAKYDVVTNYKDTYSINYELDGGTLTNKRVSYKAGQEVILGVPTKKGYTFLGWYMNEEYVGSNIKTITISDYGNKTLYAKWVEENAEYIVTFVDHKGNIVETQSVKYGLLAKEVSFEDEAFIDYSWYLGNRTFDFGTPITDNITLNAKWSILENILDDLVPNMVADDLDLPYEIDTSLGTIDVNWDSSDVNTLSVRGAVNPLREDTVVTLTATFSLENQSYTHKADVVVKAVQFRDLSKTTPVFAYLASSMGSYKGLSGIPEQTIDVINYCFARITNSGIVSMGELIKTSTVIQARKQGIRVLFSVGAYGYGATGCENISKAASTAEGRKKLIDSIIYNIQRHHFDGVDIDWEYPGSYPADGISSWEDRNNYDLFMQELRVALDELGPGYLLTAALPGGNNPSSRYNIKVLSEVLDYLHIMSYDLRSSSRTTHHTALYNSQYTPYGSVDSSVQDYSRAGFPKEKLVVGGAFYGRIWTLSSTPTNPIGASNILARDVDYVTYTSIKQNYLTRPTVKTYWDDVACAPYLFDTASGDFISYDNPRSLMLKCQYVVDNGLGGIMFWDYGEDQTGTLITAIYNALKNKE